MPLQWRPIIVNIRVQRTIQRFPFFIYSNYPFIRAGVSHIGGVNNLHNKIITFVIYLNKITLILHPGSQYHVNIISTHPHNFYIQLLAETGIVGFTILISSFFYILYCFYRQLKSIFLKEKRFLSDYQVCLLAGILISVWPFSPNGNFFHNWLIIVSFITRFINKN